MVIKKIHHVAYRCKDAKETVEWYQKYLGLDYILAFAEDHVPSTREPDPYIHVFLNAGGGNVLAFFELPTKPEMSKDPNTPNWVQHLALEVESLKELAEAKQRLESDGIEVIGPIDHALFQSIYFFDPNGHRLELTFNSSSNKLLNKLDKLKWDMLNDWSKTKKAPQHARWLHDGSYKDML